MMMIMMMMIIINILSVFDNDQCTYEQIKEMVKFIGLQNVVKKY